MLQKIIRYLLISEICIGLFHVGMGIEGWRSRGVHDLQTLYIAILALATWAIYKRLGSIPMRDRGVGIFFEHALLVGVITWFFYSAWGYDWEIFLIIFTTLSLTGTLMIRIYEHQYDTILGGGNWQINDIFWSFGLIVSLTNTVLMSLLCAFFYAPLSFIWIFFGISWIFLWKSELKKSA